MASAEQRWARIKQLFAEASALPANERAAWLAGACEDASVRDEVASLLAADHDDAFLQTRAGETTRIGAFTLRRVLGAGGMGTVWEAEQDAPRRTVALKVLRPFGAAGAARRFQHEAEILARLRHPGIAQVFAAGTTVLHGVEVPWFAMEHVPNARTLSEWVAQARPDRAQRLQAFLAVCDAVQHGHQHGVVHRDLKPANVLVGDDAVVKVIDFGVARAVGLDDARTSLHTAAGELLGTLGYMSPEQCVGDAAAVSTRSDVHALGVLLYELLTGRLPFPVQGLDLLAGLRVVAMQLPAPAPELAGDMAAVVDKALQKRPDDRYASVAAFADDVRCVLEGRPTQARPATLMQQLRGYARRHRGRVLAAAAMLVVLVVATVVSSVFAVQASRRADETAAALVVAREQRDGAQQNLDLLLRALQSANPLRERADVSMGELLRGVERELAARPIGDAYARARLHRAIGGAYRGIGDAKAAIAHAEQALAALRSLPVPHAFDEADALLLLATATAESGDAAAALPRHEAVLQALPPSGAEPLAVLALSGLGALQLGKRDHAAAAATFERALAVPRTAGDEDARAEVLANLGTLQWQRGDVASAAASWQQALDLFAASLWPEHPTVAQVRSNFGLVLQQRGAHAEARAMFTAARDLFAKLRGAESIDVANAELKLAFLAIDTAQYDEAARAFAHALTIRCARFGDDGVQVPPVRQGLAYLALQQGRFAEALAEADAALQLRQQAGKQMPRDLADCELLRGRALLGMGKVDDARPLLQRVHEQRRQEFGAEHARTAMAASAHGECLLAAGDASAARPLLELAAAKLAAALPASHPERQAAQARLAKLPR